MQCVMPAAVPAIAAAVAGGSVPETGAQVVDQVPHPDTVCRVLERLDPAGVDAAYARYQATQLADLYDTGAGELVPVTVDGKSQRGTADGAHRARHRLGAMLAQDALTLAQLDVDGKSNEITAFIPLLDQIGDLRNMVISADMMHTRREHARYLHKPGAHFVPPVGGDQPGLFDQLDALGWNDVPVGWTTWRPWPRPPGDPHHPGPPSPQGDQVPPCPAGVPDRTALPGPDRRTPVPPGRARGHRPDRPPGRPPTARRTRPR